MTTAQGKRARSNAALLPTVLQLLAMYAAGYRGRRWAEAFARLKTTADLLTTKETTDDAAT